MALEAVGRIHGCVVVHHPVAGRLGDDRRRGDRRALAVSTDHLPVTLSVDSEPIDQQGSVVRQGNSAGKMQAGAGDLAIRLRRLIPALSPIAEANPTGATRARARRGDRRPAARGGARLLAAPPGLASCRSGSDGYLDPTVSRMRKSPLTKPRRHGLRPAARLGPLSYPADTPPTTPYRGIPPGGARVIAGHRRVGGPRTRFWGS